MDDIINGISGRNGWREIIATMIRRSSSTAPRPNDRCRRPSFNLSQKALQQIENRIDKASAPQAAIVYGILRDKERLGAGEPTEISVNYTRQEIGEWTPSPLC